MTRDQMPAWLVEITGIDNMVTDDNVEILISRAHEPIIRDVSGEPQADMTFRADPNPRMQNKVRGKIENGRLTSEQFDFYMIGDPFSVTEYVLRKARVRFDFKPDGTARGLIGGFQPWEHLYVSWALGGAINEMGLSMDVAGVYYSMRKLADGDPDPKTGMNMSISTSYVIEALPAFVVRTENVAAK